MAVALYEVIVSGKNTEFQTPKPEKNKILVWK